MMCKVPFLSSASRGKKQRAKQLEEEERGVEEKEKKEKEKKPLRRRSRTRESGKHNQNISAARFSDRMDDEEGFFSPIRDGWLL